MLRAIARRLAHQHNGDANGEQLQAGKRSSKEPVVGHVEKGHEEQSSEPAQGVGYFQGAELRISGWSPKPAETTARHEELVHEPSVQREHQDDLEQQEQAQVRQNDEEEVKQGTRHHQQRVRSLLEIKEEPR